MVLVPSSYTTGRTRRHLILASDIWLSLLTLCFSLNDNPANIDTGTSCEKLQQPKHGEYQCITTEAGEMCKLVCQEGYVVSNNEYNHDGKHIALELRGIYTCTAAPGGLLWIPPQFVDCIPLVLPASFVYYYSLTLTPHPHPCLNDSARAGYLANFGVNTPSGRSREACRSELMLTCLWTYDMRCRRGAWAMDAWFKIPFSVEMINRFNDWYSMFDRYTANESVYGFTIKDQRDRTIIKSNGFYIECPMGTRMERDYTCRGCSQGYYMSLSLQECLPCPARHYQDEDYSSICKPCPFGGDKKITGVTKVVDCFYFSYWEEGTGLDRIIAGLSCIVLFSTLMLFYRSRIRNEPDGESPEVYMEPRIEAVGGGRLLRLVRSLHPMSMFPSQFDNMSIAVQLPSQTTRAASIKAIRKSLLAQPVLAPSSQSEDSSYS